MSRKIKLTRPELRRQREALERFERYLPMLKLKQQQLQLTVRETLTNLRASQKNLRGATEKFEPYRSVLSDVAGVNVRELSAPETVRTSRVNIAGINVPVFEGVEFPRVSYSLFATPPWVDQALKDLREISRHQAELDVLREQYRLLLRELTKIIQRVNLFEKVKIPEAREAIRVIRIHLGDAMTAAVGRAKIAKAKLAESEAEIYEYPKAANEEEMAVR